VSTEQTRRKDAIYNGIALSAVGVISLLFAGIQGSEAARLETDRITTQGIITRKFRDRRQQEGQSRIVRLVEVRYLSVVSPIAEDRVQTEAASSPFDSPRDGAEPWGDRPPLFPNAMESMETPAEGDQILCIEVLSSSLFQRLQVGAVVDFSYRLSEPSAARLVEELSLWQPPIWEYGVMGVTFGGAVYFFLKAIFIRREAARKGRSPLSAKRQSKNLGA